jgi:NADH dehydrogenase
VLGGGFGGVTAARQLERLCAGHARVEVTLVSRDNFFILTPLLFEACSGRLELRHCAQPIRPALRRARFIEATVREVDVERRVVHAVAPSGAAYELPYDQLVVALGATTNESLIPGSPHALTFKSMTDALLLRNRIIEQFERADAAGDTGAPPRREHDEEARGREREGEREGEGVSPAATREHDECERGDAEHEDERALGAHRHP